jgi:hypothetical protein
MAIQAAAIKDPINLVFCFGKSVQVSFAAGCIAQYHL